MISVIAGYVSKELKDKLHYTVKYVGVHMKGQPPLPSLLILFRLPLEVLSVDISCSKKKTKLLI